MKERIILCSIACAALSLFITALTLRADEQFAILKVGDEVYSNVTVTAVTATDIYFSHAKGIGNAKLKNLSLELRRHFDYRPSKARDVEKAQSEGNAQFRMDLANQKPVPPSPAQAGTRPAMSETGDEPDLVDPNDEAQSFLGKPAPGFVVEKWLTPAPDTWRKFVLIDFWATWCGPCRGSIPTLNAIHDNYKDRIVVIGVSAEREVDVRAMKSPEINYAVAIDTQMRMYKTVGVQGIPHALLIDPRGIVRYEGHPDCLRNRAALEHLLAKYSD